MKRLLALVLLLPLLASATSFDERPFAAHATHEQLVAAAARATPEAFPDADTVALHDGEHVAYDASGRFLDVAEVCVKVLTERGRRDTRTQSFYYSAHYAKPPRFVVAEILHPDGTASSIDTAAHTKEQIDRSSMSANIYDPNNKIVELSVPDLQIGDSLHLVVENEHFKARVENSWSDWSIFETTDPILYAVYEVSAPNALPIRSIQLRAPVEGSHEYTTAANGNSTLHRWEFRDIPQVFKEPDMPALYTCVQRLLLSTESDWRDLSRWYDRLCQPRLAAVNDAMREKVAELLRGVGAEPPPSAEGSGGAAPPSVVGAEPPPSAGVRGAASSPTVVDPSDPRIRAVFDFVSQQIRYMGITDEDVSPGYEPHDVSLTFDNRYGVCRDKAALLVAMLRLAGFKAHPVLISVGSRKDPDVPQPFFNHAIVAVDRGEGEGAVRYILMDPTNEKSRDLFPAYLYNYDFLVASPDGETLHNAGPAPVLQNLVRVRTTGTLDADRTLVLESRISFDGVNDAIYRGSFAQWKPEERERYFEKVLRTRLPGAELLIASITPDDLGNTDLPLEATLRYRADNVPVDGSGAWLLRLPWLSPALGFSPRVLGSTGLETRRFPLELLPTCGEDETIDIRMESGAIGDPLSLPAPVHVHSGALDFEHSATFADGTLHAARHTHLLSALVDPADYAALRTDLHTQEAATRRQAVFAPPQGVGAEPPPSAGGSGGAASPSVVARAARPRDTTPPAPPAPDAEILLDATVIDLDSDRAWIRTDTTRTRILTYAGVKDRSELTFNFNPAFESVEVVSATVTAPDGTVQTVSDKELNLMDAAWTASAPRYPAAKTLVVSLPGVQEGSVIETVVRRKSWDQPWFAGSFSFRGSDPVKETTLTVTLPEDAPFALRLHENDDAHPATIGSANDRTVYSWRFTDLPAEQPENHLPPAWLRTPSVQISSRPDFGSYLSGPLSRLRDLAQDPAGSSVARLKGADIATSVDASLKGNAASPQSASLEGGARRAEGVIRAIRDFVATSIRTAGPNFLDLPPAKALTAPDTTLADGYGHQADVIVLLMALLEGAGITDYELVPVCAFGSESTDILQPLLDIPMSRAFSKLLLRVPCSVPGAQAPGSIWLGDTDQYALLGATPSEDAITLVSAASFGTVETVFPTSDSSGFRINLSADGSANVTSSSDHNGASFGPFNKTYTEMRPEDRRRHHLELVGGLARGAVPNGDLVTDLANGTRTFAADIAEYAVRDGKMLYLTLPGLPSNPLGINSSKARENGFYLGPQLAESTSSVTVVLPKETSRVLIAPPAETFKLPGLGIIECKTEQTTDADGRDLLTVTRILRLKEGIVPADRYFDLVSLSESLQHPRFSTLLLELKE